MPYGTLALDAISTSGNLAITGNTTIAGNTSLTGTILNSSGRPIVKQSGSILQVIQTTMLGTFSTTSTSFVDLTGMSATITPSSASSSIMVFVYSIAGQTAFNSVQVNLVRNGITIFQPSSGSFPGTNMGSITANNDAWNCSFCYLDSPATSSAITYKLQCRTNAGTLSFGVRGDGGTNTPGSLILMEVAG